jgi:outer membrane protein TolC
MEAGRARISGMDKVWNGVLLAGRAFGPGRARAREENRVPSRSLSPSVLAAAALALLTPGCALLGESQAQKRFHELVEVPEALPPAPRVAAPSPESEEEGQIRRKRALGLLDCSRLAVLRSERLHAQSERVHQADLAQLDVGGILLPTVHYKSAYFSQDERVPVAVSRQPNEYRQHQVQFTQPVFHGFRDWFALAAAEDKKDESQAQLRAGKLEIALECGRAFYTVVALEKTVDTLAHSLELENTRFAEVKAREESGLARKTERLFIESERARTEADLAQARHDLAGARANLGYFTGLPDAALDASDVAPNAPGPVDGFLASVPDRPDVAALAREVEYQRHEAWVARGEFLPNVDVTANSYMYREGTLANTGWDFGVNLDWGVFDGGRTAVHVRQAESRAREAERNYSDARQRAEADVRAAYQAFLASLDRIPALETQVRSSEENVKLLESEYRAGIASNLEAVEAENTRRQAHLDLTHELYTAHRLELELRAAAGDESLSPGAYPPSPRDPAPPGKK